MGFWERKETAHDRAVKTVKSFLKKKHAIKFTEDKSIGVGRRPDLSAYDEAKNAWYLCEIKDKRGDLQRALDQFDHNRSFLEKKYRKCRIICYIAITKELHDELSTSKVGAFKDWQARMKKINIKVLVASKSTVRAI